MTKLLAVEPKKTAPKKPKILIFGKSGVGKTFTALDFPKAYYIDTEAGATRPHYTQKLHDSGGVYLGHDHGSLSFDTIIGQVKALATQKHEYKTLVIDSVSKLYNTAIGDEQERLGDKDAFGASKKIPVQKMRSLIGWLSRIDMNVILIAHEKDEYGVDAKGVTQVIGKTYDAWDKLEYELDLTMQIVKAGKNRNALVRKSRLKEFEENSHFLWSYSEFSERYGKEIIEKESKALDLATDEQMERIKFLVQNTSLPDGQESKWLAASGVSGWDEMPADRVQAAIEHIETTYTT